MESPPCDRYPYPDNNEMNFLVIWVWKQLCASGPLVHDSLLVGGPPIGSGLVVCEVLLYIGLLASWLVMGWSSH